MSEEPRPFILLQFGIFAQGTHAHSFLEFDLKPDVTAEEAVASRALMADAYEASNKFLAEVEPAGPGLYGDPPLLTAGDQPEMREDRR